MSRILPDASPDHHGRVVPICRARSDIRVLALKNEEKIVKKIAQGHSAMFTFAQFSLLRATPVVLSTQTASRLPRPGWVVGAGVWLSEGVDKRYCGQSSPRARASSSAAARVGAAYSQPS